MRIVTLTMVRAARVLWRLALGLAGLVWPALVLAAAIMALVGAPPPAALAALGAAWLIRRARGRR